MLLPSARARAAGVLLQPGHVPPAAAGAGAVGQEPEPPDEAPLPVLVQAGGTCSISRDSWRPVSVADRPASAGSSGSLLGRVSSSLLGEPPQQGRGEPRRFCWAVAAARSRTAGGQARPWPARAGRVAVPLSAGSGEAEPSEQGVQGPAVVAGEAVGPGRDAPPGPGATGIGKPFRAVYRAVATGGPSHGQVPWAGRVPPCAAAWGRAGRGGLWSRAAFMMRSGAARRVWLALPGRWFRPGAFPTARTGVSGVPRDTFAATPTARLPPRRMLWLCSAGSVMSRMRRSIRSTPDSIVFGGVRHEVRGDPEGLAAGRLVDPVRERDPQVAGCAFTSRSRSSIDSRTPPGRPAGLAGQREPAQGDPANRSVNWDSFSRQPRSMSLPRKW